MGAWSRTFKKDAGEVIVGSKCLTSDGFYAAWDGKFYQAVFFESISSDRDDTFWNGNAFQIRTVVKFRLMNGGDTVRYGDAGQTGAVGKSAVSNRGDAIRENNIREGTKAENLDSDEGNAIGNIDALEISAVPDSPHPY